ncbi:hypothetical protein ACHAO5_001671 [Verticillium nonalfalfae]
MAEGHFILPSGDFGPGFGPELANTFAAYPDTQCTDGYFLLDDQRDIVPDDYGGFALGPFNVRGISPPDSVTRESVQSRWKQPETSELATTPPPTPKRGHGMPRKNETVQGPRKKARKPVASTAKPLTLPQSPLPESSDPRERPDSPRAGGSRGNMTRKGHVDKQERRRDRNREAAQKCRARKIRSIQKLVADVAAVEVVNESLRKEAAGLRDEALLLKNTVLQHGDCDCACIQAYIKLAALRLATRDGNDAVPQSTSPLALLGPRN